MNTSSCISIAHGWGPLESTTQNQTCNRGLLSDLSQPSLGEAEGTCQGGYGQGHVGRLIHSTLLEKPACSGDMERATALPFTNNNVMSALTPFPVRAE